MINLLKPGDLQSVESVGGQTAMQMHQQITFPNTTCVLGAGWTTFGSGVLTIPSKSKALIYGSSRVRLAGASATTLELSIRLFDMRANQALAGSERQVGYSDSTSTIGFNTSYMHLVEALNQMDLVIQYYASSSSGSGTVYLLSNWNNAVVGGTVFGAVIL